MEASGGGDRRDHRDGGGRKSKRFLCFEENMGELAKTGELVHRENWRGKNRMRIREGSQVKTGMAEEKETKGIDYQTWEFTGREYLENSGNQSWDCRRCEPALLPGVVGMHCCGSGWNRMFSHVSEKPDSETERGAVRQLPGSDCVDAHGTAFRLSMEMQCWRRQDSWNSRWEKKTFWYRNCAGCVIK